MNIKRKSTSWQNLSRWYDAIVGSEGTYLHPTLVIPQLAETLNIKPGKTVLDIGCGNGFLSKFITKSGANYHGIDSSRSLIDRANSFDQKGASYTVGDICNAKSLKSLKPKSFDTALFILSLQDIDPLERAIMNASQLLKDRSEIIIFMLHPAFKTPRQTGFVFDENRKMISRRIDSYLSPNHIPFKKDKRNRSYVANFYHRPLQDYINTLSTHGFDTKHLSEMPAYSEKIDQSRIEKRILNEIPMFMMIKAVRSNP